MRKIILPEAQRYNFYPPWLILMLNIMTFPAVMSMNILLGSTTKSPSTDSA